MGMLKETPEGIVKRLLDEGGDPQLFALNLSEFREVCDKVQKAVPGTPVDIVLNGELAIVQFSLLCSHRISVVRDPPHGLLPRLTHRRILTEKDFEFASPHSEFYGATKRLSVWGFLREEVSENWVALLLTLLTSSLAFSALVSTQEGKAALEKINESLMTAATLYLSVFILFTVSQNVDLVKDLYLFRRGLTHRFFRVDRLLASLAVVVLCISVLNIVVINLPSSISFSLFSQTFVLPDLAVVAPHLTAVGITILVDCFLALIKYYFRRVRYVLEKDLTRELLAVLWNERNVGLERQQPSGPSDISHALTESDRGREAP